MTDKQINAYYKNKPAPLFHNIKNDSIDLFCATTGADTLPPLLMIHGAPGAWYGSRNLLEDSILQKQFHIIAVDRPGYNRSRYKGKRRAVTSILLQANIIQQALQINRSGKTGIVMGSSYGAPIAAKIAVLYPEAYHHVVLLAAAIDPEREKFWWFHKYINSGLLIQLLPRYIRTATAEKFTHAAELEQMLPDWKRLIVPVTVVQGTADHIIDPENLAFAQKQLAGRHAEFILITGAGHLLRFSNTSLIRNILARSAKDVHIR
ncbi:MAG TPA: alpha/beta fold hydrolase [Flavitalea sp.]|nr:alpha/beta fold hydrolase [Flavitalea sp.]